MIATLFNSEGICSILNHVRLVKARIKEAFLNDCHFPPAAPGLSQIMKPFPGFSHLCYIYFFGKYQEA